MKNKILILLALVLFISSCAGNKRSQKSDEFLIEKKKPLVIPPDIDELPTPKGEQEIVQNDDNFKEIIKSKKNKNNNVSSDENSSLKDSILKKIEQ